MIQREHDTFLNKVWDYTIGKVPEKIIIGALGLTAAGFLVAGGINKIQDHNAEEALKADRLAYEAHVDSLVATEDSLLTYGLTLVNQGNLDSAEEILTELSAVRPNFNSGHSLDSAIDQARSEESQANKLYALRLGFTGNTYFATEDAHTLWDIAPIYWEALTGESAKFGDQKQWGNLWMDMVKHRKSLGKDAETIEVGERVELPAKGLTDIMSQYKGHRHLSF